MKCRLQATGIKVFFSKNEYILKKVEGCTDFYANKESNTLKELSDDTLVGYLEDCLSYILICYSSNCITVRGV